MSGPAYPKGNEILPGLQLAKLDDRIITKFPRLEKFLNDISSIDTVSNYLNNRPDLIDVSIEPKLDINSKIHPTGTKQT